MTDLVRCYVEMDTLAYEMMKREVAGESDKDLCRKYFIAVDMFVAAARAYYGGYHKGKDELITLFKRDDAVQAELQSYIAGMAESKNIAK